MADDDIVARVYAHGHHEGIIAEAWNQDRRYRPAQASTQAPSHTWRRGERPLTEPLAGGLLPDHHYKPCMELRFSDTPRSSHGIVFGRDPDSDIPLPNFPCISHHHFTLTFDDQNRLIVKDWSSLVGTQVTYNNEGEGLRSGFQWIIVGRNSFAADRRIIVSIPYRPAVQLHIVPGQHDTESSAYIDKVQRFREGSATAEDLFRGLDMPNRPETQMPTGVQTPGAGPIYLRKKLGEGAFAVVTHCWDVSTAHEFAIKEPSAKAIKHRRVKVDSWRNEAHIMGLISHVSLFYAHQSRAH